MTLSGGVLSERRTGMWHECWVCGYLMGLHYMGVAFPYTAAERDWFDPQNVSGSLDEMDVLAAKRYGVTLAKSTVPLATLITQPGNLLVVDGANARMTKAMHHWDPAYMGQHTMAVEPLGNGTSRVYDPEAPQGFAGEVFPNADILYWADKTPDTYRVAQEATMQYEYKLERWTLDGKGQVTTLGAPYAANGTVDYSSRLAVVGGGATPQKLDSIARGRLTPLTTGPASKPLSDAFWAAFAAYALPTAGLTQAQADAERDAAIAALKAKIAAL